MPTPTSQAFVNTLRKSHLLTPEQMAVANDVSRRLDAIATAKDLIKRDWITEWQARQLLAGKSKLFLGKYRLLDVLGQGGMGAVLKAESSTLKRIVALKVMSTDLIENEIAMARFEREIQFAATVNHPNIVRAIDADRVGQRYYLVMEYVDGRDLKAMMKEHGQFPIDFACECARQAATGLQHAHERGLVHRDIKPSNLLIARDPQSGRPIVKLLDLGLARLEQEGSVDGSITRAGQIMGSPDYMAPEQATDSRNADIRADIFGLGVTLFQMIAGRLPFSGGSVMQKLVQRINEDAPPVSQFRPDAPPVLVRIIARMLHRDATQRFQTPGEVAAILQEFVADPDSESLRSIMKVPAKVSRSIKPEADDTLNLFVDQLDSRASKRPVGVRRRRKNLMPVVISIGVAVLIVGGILFALSQKSGPESRGGNGRVRSASKRDTAAAVVERSALNEFEPACC